MARNDTIDVMKGFLMLTVIVGHALIGSLDDNVLRYIIYSFHMPLFLFISGFLTNMDKLKSKSLKEVWTKYWGRMTKEWMFATIVYIIVLCFINELTIKYIIRWHVIVPYYHLWYVPILLIMIISAWFIESQVKDKSQRIFLYLFLSLCFYGIYNVGYGLLSEYRLHYFSFYYLGLLCKEYNISVNLSTIQVWGEE